MLRAIIYLILGCFVLLVTGCATPLENVASSGSKSEIAQGRLGYVQSKSQDVDFKKFEYQLSMDMTTSMSVEQEDRQLLNLCKIYSGEPNPAENMIDTCTQAIEANGASRNTKTASYYNRGLIKQKLDRLDEARSDFNAAIDLDSNFGDGYLGRASLSMLEDDVLSARRDIETALTKKVRHPEYAHYLLGHALEADNKFIEARAQYRQALTLRPNWRDAMRRVDRINISWPEEN